MNDMKLLAVVTLPSIYHSCSTWKNLWGEEVTLVSMKNCTYRNVRKHRDINNGEQYIALGISIKFGNLNKIKITSSESKSHLGITGKELTTSLGLKVIRKLKKVERAKFSITEFSRKYLYNIIREFKDVHYKGYVRKRYKHIPPYSYLYTSRNLAKFIMSTQKMSNSRGSVGTQTMITQKVIS